MVCVGIEIIHANGVDAKNLHKSSIAHTGIDIGEGILAFLNLVSGAATRLVANTNHLEALASFGDVELIALDFDRLDGGDDRGRQGHESGLDL